MMISEFTAAGGSAPRAAFDTRTPGRWIVSHLRCYPVVLALAVLCQLASWSMFALTPVMIGRAAQVVIDGHGSRELLLSALGLLGVMVGNAVALLSVTTCAVNITDDVFAAPRPSTVDEGDHVGTRLAGDVA